MAVGRVLVIEDDPVNLEIVERRLANGGYETVGAGTGEAGLAAAIAGAFDLVLLDLRLPDRDGLEVLGALRVSLPDLPVVVMTAHGSEAIAEQARAAGAAAFLVKPVRYATMLETITAARRNA